MLKKSLGILVIVALLCGAVPFLEQEAAATDCAALWELCDDAKKAAAIICTLAVAEPTFLGEPACALALIAWGAACSYAQIQCGG